MKRFWLLLCLLPYLLIAAEGAPIGTVVTMEGLVRGVGSESQERLLEPGFPIFVAETIIVAPKGSAQIRFTDGGVMNLIADSEFRVDAYRYREARQKDQFAANLFKGGLRSLSGSIPKKNPQGYEIQTPSATVGLRGTVIEVSIVGSQVFFGITDGRAIIANGAGTQLIGVGEKGQFALVPSPNEEPRLLNKRPPQLDLKLFVPGEGGINLDRANARQVNKIGPQEPANQPAKTETAPIPSVREGALPSEAPAAETTPSSSEAAPRETEVPTIGETQEPADFQFQPSGGGGAIQGGC